MTPQPFTAESPPIGTLFCVLLDTKREANIVAASPNRDVRIPAYIVRSGTGEHEIPSVRRRYP